ncbi:glycosyltransferase family 4 protein [Haloferax chudinovii]|uniref:Glycosyltransferase family 4 protein n=1 Tax=Haloferax chudinovii TaxID=1109010 RepID=A0ABD5XKF3_9EURY
MHVLYIVGQSTGGLPHYAAELANSVANSAEVTVFKPTETSADDLFRDDIELVNAFDPIGISMPGLYKLDINPLNIFRGLYSYSAVKEIEQYNPDVIHDSTGIFPQVKFFAKLHDVDDYPFVTTRHEVPVNRFSLARPPVLIEEILNLTVPDIDEDRTVVHTKRQKEVLVSRGFDADGVVVIPHGAYSVFGGVDDIEREPEENTLLFFGNIVPPKGLDVLVDAVERLREAIPDVNLIIAGDGQLSSGVRKTIERYPDNFEVHRRFIPNDEVKEFFARATVVVMPYRDQRGTKGHSGVLSTAFSFGKPVVASTASEFPEQVEDEGCGLVVPPENPTRLASALETVLRDESARSEMSQNCVRMSEQLSWDSVAQQYLDVYSALAGAHELGDKQAVLRTP